MFSFMIRSYFRQTCVEDHEVLLEVSASRCSVLWSDHISDKHVLNPMWSPPWSKCKSMFSFMIRSYFRQTCLESHMKSSSKLVQVTVQFYDQIIFQTHMSWIPYEVFLEVSSSWCSVLWLDHISNKHVLNPIWSPPWS